jgi:membrane-bound lytic murein transglycosylase D
MYKRIFIISVILSVFSISYLSAGNSSLRTDSIGNESIPVFQLTPDDPIAAMLDSLALLTVFNNIEKRTPVPANITNFPAGFVPQYDDSVLAARFKKLNDNSTIEFVYNAAVKGYIGLYASRRRDLTERVMGLGELYFPLFEEQLDKYNLPLELKYLAVIESALNPIARSRVGATGLWQFMYGTGKMYGLQVTSVVDDRSDIYKSTVAACEHFVDLYKIYKDWNLVLCAYNAGPGNVNRAIRRAGGVRDFWAIRQYLPQETRNYVPAFMAVAYVMEHTSEHNLFPNPPIFSHFDVDTITVTRQLSLKTVSEFLNIPLDHLRFLNPTFRQNIIPYNETRPYVIRLPRDYTGTFIANAETIYNHRSPEQQRQEMIALQVPETTTHVVKSGEALGTIARKYNTSVSELQRLNNIRGTTIRVGQRLVVNAPARPASSVASNTNTHVVKRGETLGVIAARYKVNVNDIKRWNNLTSANIQVGQNLIVRRPVVVAAIQQPPLDDNPLDDETEPEYFYYTVQQGDTLNGIAAKYEHISIEEIKELNELSPSGSLQPGQRLKILMDAQSE